MRVRFIADHRGVETDEIFYQAGDEAEVLDSWVPSLVAMGHAEPVETAKPGKKSKPMDAPAQAEMVSDAVEVKGGK